jgi:hypothetical protein
MRHIKVNDKGKVMMIDHDFADFHIEVELNVDNPSWASKLVEVAAAGYSQIKEGGKDPRVNSVDSKGLTPLPVEKSPQRQVQLGLSSGNKDETEYSIEESIDAGVKKGMSEIKDGQAKRKNESATMPSGTSLTDALAKKRGLVAETV